MHEAGWKTEQDPTNSNINDKKVQLEWFLHTMYVKIGWQ